LIALCPNCHRRADRGEIDRRALRLYKYNLRFAHDKFSQLEMDVLFQLSEPDADASFKWLECMLIMLKRLQDAGYITVSPPERGGLFVRGVSLTPHDVYITDLGRAFIEQIASGDLE
jgi:hypothetical protein